MTVLGIPSEEGHGGKVKLIEKGAFENTDIYSHDDLSFSPSNHMKFHGKMAHAVTFRLEGSECPRCCNDGLNLSLLR